jgi:hypothetical protein
MVWLIVTLLTRPVARATLLRFYELVRPAGPGWNGIREETGVAASPDSLPQAFLGWVLGCTLVYAALMGTGSFLYGRTVTGIVCAGLAVVSGLGLARLLATMWTRREPGGVRGRE